MPDLTIGLEYESLDKIPEAARPLYDEVDGKFVLAGVEGMKTQADVDRLQEALRKERNDHNTVKGSLQGWSALGDDPSAIAAKLDRIAELEAAAGDKLDETKIEEIVSGRLKQHTGPLERNLQTITAERDELKSSFEALQLQLQRRDLNEAVRQVATEMKVVPSAVLDIEMVAAHYLEKDPTSDKFIVKDGTDITPGLDVNGFLREMQKKRPHWWPASAGGGAGGGGALGSSNPWSKDGWNLTEQGKVVRERGMEQAQALAKAAGSSVGGTRPK